ncbi:MAG: SHOCT domain-containing protein, partial [Proteobacteria bacterium]|nr:SHOCT domain-containing protein [Pseudomonadota bacterium]
LDAPSDDPAPVLSGLERLVVLRSAGALNEDEFERAKAQVLATGA